MAVSNKLSKGTTTAKKTTENAVVKYMSNGVEIKLTPSIVKSYLVSGDKDRVTDQEVAMFINLCKYAGLNPWLKEAYCIKYGTEPATMVTGKEAFTKRAEHTPEFDGMQAGIITIDGDGEVRYREGAMKAPDEEIIGGWAEVFRKDRTHSTRIEVSFDEYAARKKDGTLNQQWSKKPATMIRKVAIVQALREAFPTNMGGMYAAEELGETEAEAGGVMAQPEINDETGEVIDAEVVEKKPARKEERPEPEDPGESLI